MNIDGEIEVNGEKLERRDAIGIWETNEIEIRIQCEIFSNGNSDGTVISVQCSVQVFSKNRIMTEEVQ